MRRSGLSSRGTRRILNFVSSRFLVDQSRTKSSLFSLQPDYRVFVVIEKNGRLTSDKEKVRGRKKENSTVSK